MRVLLLAPQPFYQERGTPIAVKMLLQVFAERGDTVDAIVYAEGEAVALPGLTLHRTPDLKFLRGIRPGFSLKKLICDFFMLWQAVGLALRHRYAYVHAVEESAFIGLLLKVFFRLPYIYDMDSSIAQQMVEKYPQLGGLSALLEKAEGLALRHAEVALPVCDQLRDHAQRYQPKTVVLYDVPLLGSTEGVTPEDIRRGLPPDAVVVMYVGNLEKYQGIDLLVESFALAKAQAPALELVVIGGQQADIDAYREKARALGVNITFTGPKPVAHLGAYLEQADVLASPRIKGGNTPMKLYSYLASGKPVLATDLRTHTQVLDDSLAVLTAPTPAAYAEGMARLAGDPALRAALGAAGKAIIAARYSYARFHETLTGVLAGMGKRVMGNG